MDDLSRKIDEEAAVRDDGPPEHDTEDKNRWSQEQAERRDNSGGNDDRKGNGHSRRWTTKSSWWRRNFADNFSLEYELDAKIARLRILLSSLGPNVVPALDDALRGQLQNELENASGMLADFEPFERVMQRINFVEAEIMMRLADDRIGLALEALRAEASISLPDGPAKLFLEEIDKVAVSDTQPTEKRTKILGLKCRLSATVIELFRGSERARDATLILGIALIFLTLFLGSLFYFKGELSRALFTHFGTNVIFQPPGTGTPAPANPQQIELIPDGTSPLIDFAFPVVLMAAAFGGIGACLSGLFSFTLQDRIPTEYEGYFRTLIRPMIGIASGFLALFLLRGGLFTFGEDLAWVAIVALAFGFSERLFMGTIARLESLPK